MLLSLLPLPPLSLPLEPGRRLGGTPVTRLVRSSCVALRTWHPDAATYLGLVWHRGVSAVRPDRRAKAFRYGTYYFYLILGW